MDTGSQALPRGARIGRYEITNVLGIGGFGITYKAWDDRLECTVAIKEYLPAAYAFRDRDTTTIQPLSDSAVEEYKYGLERFLEEARTLAKFKDPNIIRVLDHIEANGTAYLVMDFEEGETLAARLKREGSLSEGALLAIFLPILKGLRTVHAANILHRDIKPGNIYLRLNGSPVLIDFGSAKQHLGEHTRSLATMVTAGFAPFEQYSSKSKQGPYTDLYALGATMYRCLNGNAPLPQSSDRIISVNDHEKDPLVPAVQAGAGRYDKNLLEAVDWMLRINAKDRPQSVDKLLVKIAPAQAIRDRTAWDQSSANPTAPLPDPDIGACEEPTLPIVEIDSRDVSDRHLSEPPRRSVGKFVVSTLLGLAAITAAAVGIGISQDWIDIESYRIHDQNTSLQTEQPQNLATSTPPIDKPASGEARESLDTPENAEEAPGDLFPPPAAEFQYLPEFSDKGQAATEMDSDRSDEPPSLSNDDSDIVSAEPTNSESISAISAADESPATDPTETEISINPGDTDPFPEPPELASSPESTEIDEPSGITTQTEFEENPITDSAALIEGPSLVASASESAPLNHTAGEPDAPAIPQEIPVDEQTAIERIPVPTTPEDPAVLAERKRQSEIDSLLEKAGELEKSGKLTRPENENALDTYLKIKDLDPSNSDTTEALGRIGSRLQAISEDKLSEKDFLTAKRYVELALKIQGDQPDWLDLKQRIAAEHRAFTARQTKLDELFRKAAELEANGIPFPDSGDNAADVYLEILAIDSANGEAKDRLLNTLSANLQTVQSTPSVEQYQVLAEYALLAMEKVPGAEPFNEFYFSVQREIELWQEQNSSPKITRVVTANTEPGGDTEPQTRFALSTPRIYVAFDFKNFESGSVIRAVLFDGGKKIKLMQVPVVITSASGTRTFYLNRPVDGFQIGSYRLEMNLGNEHIATADFVIDEQVR